MNALVWIPICCRESSSRPQQLGGWTRAVSLKLTIPQRPIARVALGSITIGTSLSRQVLLGRSVATMLPRLGSTRGDSRGLEGTTVWLEREDRQRLVARSPFAIITLENHMVRVSTPGAFTAIEPCSPSRIRPVGRKSRNPPEPISTGRRRGPTSGIRVRARVRSAAALPRRRARVFCPAVIRPVPGSGGSVTRFFLRNQRPCR